MLPKAVKVRRLKLKYYKYIKQSYYKKVKCGKI